MKAPQYRSNEKELLGEKVVVKYNEDGDGMSNPSSLIETIPEHNYLTRKKVRYKTRKNVKIPVKSSSEASDIADDAKIRNGENEELDDRDQMEDDDTNSIISKDDFNWLCQKENYTCVPTYRNDREINQPEKTTLAQILFENMESLILDRDTERNENIVMIREIVEAIVANCFSYKKSEGSKFVSGSINESDSRHTIDKQLYDKYSHSVKPSSSTSPSFVTQTRKTIADEWEAEDEINSKISRALVNEGTTNQNLGSANNNDGNDLTTIQSKDKKLREKFDIKYKCIVNLTRLPMRYDDSKVNRKQFDRGKLGREKIKFNVTRRKSKGCDKNLNTNSSLQRLVSQHLETKNRTFRSCSSRHTSKYDNDNKSCDEDIELPQLLPVCPSVKHSKNSIPIAKSLIPDESSHKETDGHSYSDIEYTVEEILDKRAKSKSPEYKVKWKGYSKEESTWEPAESLDCFHLIKKFQTNFEVEKILDSRHSCIKRDIEWSQVEYLVKWKGIEEKFNTWEPFEVLSCPEMIKEYEHMPVRVNSTNHNLPIKIRLKKIQIQKILDARVVGEKHEYRIKWKGIETKVTTWEKAENLNCWKLIKDYQRFWEVDKILDKIFDNGKKCNDISGIAYLVRWKLKSFDEGYCTWEPLEVLSCIDLIQKFEKNKKLEQNDLTSSSKTKGMDAGAKHKSQRAGRKRKNEEEVVVEQIKDKRIAEDGSIEYLIKWQNLSDDFEHDHSKLMGITWEPLENLNCKELIHKYENENPFHRYKSKAKNTPSIESKLSNQNKTKKAQKLFRKPTLKTNDKDNDVLNGDKAKISDEYVVETIIDRHVINAETIEYFVKWKGYSYDENTWEPSNHLYCFDLIRMYLSRFSVNSILKKRVVEVDDEVNRTGIEYLVSWKGYSEKHNTWEPLEVLECNDLIRKWERSCITLEPSGKKTLLSKTNVSQVNAKSKKETTISIVSPCKISLSEITNPYKKEYNHKRISDTVNGKNSLTEIEKAKNQHKQCSNSEIIDQTQSFSEVKVIKFSKTNNTNSKSNGRNVDTSETINKKSRKTVKWDDIDQPASSAVNFRNNSTQQLRKNQKLLDVACNIHDLKSSES